MKQITSSFNQNLAVAVSSLVVTVTAAMLILLGATTMVTYKRRKLETQSTTVVLRVDTVTINIITCGIFKV